MKKEVMDILQNELVFDHLSGSAGNITAVSMGDKHYFREKGKSEDRCHVTFTLHDYRRSFNIDTLDRREVFVKVEYDLVDMQSGFHWTSKKVLNTKLM